jgi:hypothetical protein
MPGELSPQFEDRFVEGWLDHQIAVLEDVGFVGRGDVAEPVQQAVEPAQRVVFGHVGEFVAVEAGVAEFDQSGRPVQPPLPFSHRPVDFGVVGVG